METGSNGPDSTRRAPARPTTSGSPTGSRRLSDRHCRLPICALHVSPVPFPPFWGDLRGALELGGRAGRGARPKTDEPGGPIARGRMMLTPSIFVPKYRLDPPPPLFAA
ncbi:hypothetical protein NL676_003109 [Syzygium grande]|nr:hypothetical protein NL676_003109 [Syzygium grande]